MSSQDPYSVLGVPRNAGPEDIKKAYRRLALQLHPDKASPDPGNVPADVSRSEEFLLVQQAYHILSRPRLRALYDRDHPVNTPVKLSAEELLAELVEIRYQLQQVHFISGEPVAEYLLRLLTTDSIGRLRSGSGLLQAAAAQLMAISEKLGYPALSSLHLMVATLEDPELTARFRKLLRKRRSSWIWHRRKPWIVLLLTLLLLALMIGYARL